MSDRTDFTELMDLVDGPIEFTEPRRSRLLADIIETATGERPAEVAVMATPATTPTPSRGRVGFVVSVAATFCLLAGALVVFDTIGTGTDEPSSPPPAQTSGAALESLCTEAETLISDLGLGLAEDLTTSQLTTVALSELAELLTEIGEVADDGAPAGDAAVRVRLMRSLLDDADEGDAAASSALASTTQATRRQLAEVFGRNGPCPTGP